MNDSDVYDVQQKKEDVQTYSPIIGYAFTINYILGVGILAIPNAFMNGGLVFSPLILLLATFISTLTCNWLVETSSRAKALSVAGIIKGSPNIQPTESSYLLSNVTDLTPSIQQSANQDALFTIGTEKFENNELLGIFIGKWAKYAYIVLICIYMYIPLWSYSSVVASSLTSIFPLPGLTKGLKCDIYQEYIPIQCEYAYLIYMAIFMVIVVPISCMDLTEQVVIQAILCIFRFVAVFLMFITTVIVLYRTPYVPKEGLKPPYISYTTLFNIGGFGTLYPSVVFAQLLHHSVPGLIQPVNNKKHVTKMFFFGILSTCGLYTLLGISTVLYFGKDIKPQITLHWKDYDGFSFTGNDPKVWASIISYTVVLFPVIDITSCYPLHCVTLGNNIFVTLPDSITDRQRSRFVKIMCRLLSAIPPLFLGCVWRQLSLIVKIGGTLGFFIAFIIPSALQIMSRRRTQKEFGTKETPYSFHFSKSGYAFVMLIVFGFAAFIYQCVNIAQMISKGTLGGGIH